MVNHKSLSIVIVLTVLTSGLGAATPVPGIVPTDAVLEAPAALASASLVPSGLGPARTVFIENVGQFDDDGVVLFADLSQGGIAFKAGGVLVNQETAFPAERPVSFPPSSLRDTRDPFMHRKLLERPVRGCTVELTFVGCNEVIPRGEGRMPALYNYFLGDGPVDGMTGVRAYSAVIYEELYDGIDLVYRVTEAGLKYEFRVGPGADPGAISVLVSGHTALRSDGHGLVIGTVLGDIEDTGLDVFYEDGSQERLGSRFDVRGPDTYGFVVEDRDPGRTVVIDPLVFSTYLGSPDWDSVGGMLVDDEGNIYITGNSDGTTFPTTAGAYQEHINNLQDVFVVKMAPDGASLVWSTFIGGTDMDAGLDLALDDIGNVYVCGRTYSDNYPTTRDAFQSRTMGHGDAMVSKLNPSGSRLLASTIVGGFWEDPAQDIAVDGSGNMYITGTTRSTDFPTTPGAFDRIFNQTDAFVVKINSTATDLVYSTFLGGTGQDVGDSLVLDGSGSVYAVGNTRADDFPVTSGAFSTQLSGDTDSFVTKVSPDGTALEASTYLGGQFFDEAQGVALGSDGDVHVFGSTRSGDFPITAGAFQTTIGSLRQDDDAFATRMDWNLSTVKTSTFIGGDAEDYCPCGTLDSEDNVVIGGFTNSMDYPTTPGAYQTDKNAFDDIFLTKLSANYTQLLYSTHLGSVDREVGVSVAAYGALNIYVAGETFSDRFPTTPGAFQTALGGNRDAVVAMFSLDELPPVAEAGPNVTIDQHGTVQFNGSDSTDNIGIVNWTWSFKYDGANVELHGVQPSWTFDDAGLYRVDLTVMDAARQEASDSLNVTVLDITAPLAEAGLSKTIRQGETATFDGSGSSDNVGIVNWTWSFTYFGEEVVLYGLEAEFTYLKAGVFNVSLTVRDAVGLSSIDNLTINVRDLSDPVANAGEDVYVDQHEPAELNGSLSSDTTAIVNWTWGFVHAGTPMEVYGEVTSFIFEIAGTYEVLLRVFDDAGNSDVDIVTVHVRDSTAPLAVPGPDITVDEGSLVQFDGSGSSDNVGIVSYSWKFEHDGGTVVLEGVDPDYTFSVPGTYEVELAVSDAEDNVGEATLTVTVRDVTPPFAEAGAYQDIEQGDTLTFDGGMSTDSGGIASYSWSFEYDGETVTLEGETVDFTFEEAGVFEVTLTVSDLDGNTDDDGTTVTVIDTTPPVIQEIDDIAIDQGMVINVSAADATDNVGVTSYNWSFVYDGNQVTRDGDTLEQSFFFPGVYEITLTVGDAQGNSAVEPFLVTVRDTENPMIVLVGSGRSFEVGQTARVDASGSTDNVGIVKWTWTFEEGGRTVTLDGPSFGHVFDDAGEYEVTLTVEDAEGNTASETVTVTVTSSAWLYILIPIIIIAVIGSLLYLRRLRSGD